MKMAKRLYLHVCKIGRILKKNKMGERIYCFAEISGIHKIIDSWFNRKLANYNEKHPTMQMIESKEFFNRNHKRIKNVLNLLSDKESKEVLVNMIKFRCFNKYSELPSFSVEEQYFVNQFFKYNDKEVFIDCGAYNGDSIDKFKKHMKQIGKRYKIVAFEPDYRNYRELVKKHPDIIAIQAGVWKEDGELFFKVNGPTDSVLLEAGKSEKSNIQDKGRVSRVPVKSIDNTYECKRASFIKMDIEGSEYNALLGAKNIISANKPKLAICIYHSDEDMLRIAELIHSMVPEYQLFIRQHSDTLCETVLYAVC